ncbi:hypothetical protein HX834_00640 [Marine Group I thaumarchaeote]|uniref:Uncharacterized protein n=1 Tax=Marine Group I thaumarchaeote TaxID=2511932 RepID=A0A7K4MXN2_9ARCH|nr:hypothetical protein [Marine Group I thaumarchaeote]
MKKFTIALLGVIFVTLIAGSIQSISADHLEPGQGIFKEESDVELVTTHGSNYQIYLQTVFRNGDDQLINVTETTEIGMYIPHKITDHVFDTLMGKKEIITIDNIKYEKVQYIFSPTLEQRWTGFYPIFSEIPLEFKYEEGAVAKMNKKIKNYSIWKIHYCAAFEGHGYTCIPVFQALVPTMTLEPDDVVTQQWTILREMN